MELWDEARPQFIPVHCPLMPGDMAICKIKPMTRRSSCREFGVAFTPLNQGSVAMPAGVEER